VNMSTRTPEPEIAKSGAEVGSKLELTIRWYKPDRETPGHGSLEGSDAEGSWRLEFASPAELKERLASIVSRLEAVALATHEEARSNGPDGP
jgi:hypothetical protein